MLPIPKCARRLFFRIVLALLALADFGLFRRVRFAFTLVALLRPADLGLRLCLLLRLLG